MTLRDVLEDKPPRPFTQKELIFILAAVVDRPNRPRGLLAKIAKEIGDVT